MTLLPATTTAAPLKVRDYLIPGSDRIKPNHFYITNRPVGFKEKLRGEILKKTETQNQMKLHCKSIADAMQCETRLCSASEASVKGGVLGSGVLGGRIGSMSSYFFVMRDIHND